MMRKNKIPLFIVGALILLLAGCEKWTMQDKYKRPDWLPGKLYTTVAVQKDLSLFTECLHLTGLDTIINVSGSWTVFAPTDEAMREYLSENHYSAVSGIPPAELQKLTKFHIIQDQWTLKQLKILGANGWKTKTDGNTNPFAFKHETMLRNPNEKYWIKKVDGTEVIVLDSALSDRDKRVYVPSRKFAPVFYDDFLTTNSLTPADYSFYFGRNYEAGNVYYAGAKIIQADILAENGIVHIIDKVVSPMLNARERLEKETPGESYRLFLEMIYWYYPSFEPNMTATYNQPEVRLGGIVDTLWDLNYARLAFDLQKERFDNLNQTLVKHNGLIAPTDDPFRDFINGTLTIKSGFPHWNDYKSLPIDVVDLVVAQNLKNSPFYPSTSQYKKYFSEASRYHQNEGDIIRKDFGSNCTFIGLSSYIPDRVFTSVTGPVFCRPAYSIFRRAMEYSGVYDAIANYRGKLYFFPIPDFSLVEDSSLMVNWIDKSRNIYNFTAYNRNMHQMETLSSRTVSNWILNQVGTSQSVSSTNKEIIKTLGGSYITWDHNTNTIQGTRPSTFGYEGKITMTNTPVLLNEPSDNGQTFTIKYWFRF